MEKNIDKKKILSSASAVVKSAEVPAEKPAVHIRAWDWIKRRARAFYAWLRALDKLAWFNILLLFLVCAMLIIMICQVGKSKKAESEARIETSRAMSANRGAYDLSGRLNARNRPTVVVSRNDVPLYTAPARPASGKYAPAPRIRAATGPARTAALPLRPVMRDVPIVKKKISGTLLVDGHGRKAVLSPMTTIDGSLILQNMRTFTLPCGVRINGDLLLRNVALLKFCGCFEVRGNIYVSKSSSFGPLPKDAFLGGQVIF